MILTSGIHRGILLGALLAAQGLAAQSDHNAPGPAQGGSPPEISVVVSIHTPAGKALDESRIITTVDGSSAQNVQLVPVASAPFGMGIVVDSSGSTAKSSVHRPAVAAALELLTRLMRPGSDKAFWVNFNEEVWIDAQLTDDLHRLRNAASELQSRGGSKVFDSTISSCDYLARSKIPRRILLLISDGDDDASEFSRKDVIKELPRCGAILYAISTEPVTERSHEGGLRAFVDETGGLFFHPANEQEITAAMEAIEDDIRHQYLLSFAPASHDGKTHAFQVTSSNPQEVARGPRAVYVPKN